MENITEEKEELLLNQLIEAKIEREKIIEEFYNYFNKISKEDNNNYSTQQSIKNIIQ